MAKDNVAALLADDSISAPSDFPSASRLAALDSALRCDVCGEPYDAPVTMVCGHCFCSNCIRTYMEEKRECPTCRREGNEGQLRVNPALEEAVSAWQDVRADVLRMARAEHAPHPAERPKKKRKLSFSRSGSGSSSAPLTSSPAINGVEDAEDDDEIQCVAGPSCPPLKKGEVKCPICNRHVLASQINPHIDAGCPLPDAHGTKLKTKTNDTSKNAWSKLLAKQVDPDDDLTTAEPLPKTSYNVLKDKALKALLTEQGLSVTGERAAWIARHTRWVIIFNANLDRAPHLRSTRTQLLADLRRWEEQRVSGAVGRGKKVVKDGEERAWAKAQNSEFKKLTELARPRKTATPSEDIQENGIQMGDGGSDGHG